MKYISVIFIVIVMSWTWSLANSERVFRLDQYKKVEQGVEQDIRAFIQRKYPETKEIACSQLYTEAVEPGVSMIAHFRCQAATDPTAEEVTEQVFEGYLRLKSNDNFETWGETGGEINSPEVRFLKGIQVRGTEGAPSAVEDAPAAAPASAPAHEAHGHE